MPDIGDITAVIAALIAVTALVRTRRADLRLAQYSARLRATEELGRRMSTVRALAWSAHARHQELPENPTPEELKEVIKMTQESARKWKSAMAATDELRATISAWTPILPAEVLKAIGVYMEALGNTVDESDPDSVELASAGNAYVAVVREMLGTDPLAAETEALLRPRRWLRRGS